MEEEVEIIMEEDVACEYDMEDEPVPSDDEMEEGIQATEPLLEKDDANAVFQGHIGPIYAIDVFVGESTLVASGSGDDTAAIWKLNDDHSVEMLYRLIGHTDSVVAVKFSTDGKVLATAGYDGVVKIWSCENGALLKTLEGPSQDIEWICWHKKGYIILAGSTDGTVWMWLATSGDCMQVFSGHDGAVSCGQFTNSGKMVITGSSDNTLRIWNPLDGTCKHIFKGHGFHEGSLSSLCMHPTEPLVLTTSQDGTGRIVHLQTKKILSVLSHNTEDPTTRETIVNSLESAAFSPTRNWCATGCLGGKLRIWDISNGRCRHTCTQEYGITKVQWDPTGDYVMTSAVDGNVRMWDARDGQLLRTLTGHRDMILDMVSIKKDNRFGLLTSSDDNTLRYFLIN